MENLIRTYLSENTILDDITKENIYYPDVVDGISSSITCVIDKENHANIHVTFTYVNKEYKKVEAKTTIYMWDVLAYVHDKVINLSIR